MKSSVSADDNYKTNGEIPYTSNMQRDSRYDDVAQLSNDGRMIFFSFGGKCIRFLGAKCLRRFTAVKKWHAGYLEVMADNGGRIEEEYIDLVPILENLYITPETYLNPIKKVLLNYG